MNDLVTIRYCKTHNAKAGTFKDGRPFCGRTATNEMCYIVTLYEIEYHPECTGNKHRSNPGSYLCPCGASSAWHKTDKLEDDR